MGRKNVVLRGRVPCFQMFICTESITNSLNFNELTQYMCSVQDCCDLLQSERVFSIAKHAWFESGFPCTGREKSNACISRLYSVSVKKYKLGSGLVIPNEVKIGYAEDMEVSHAYPVLPFRKSDGTDQLFLSSTLTVSPVSMTGASSAAFFTLSNMDFSGRMLLRNMAHTRRCTIGSSGGAGSVFSAGSSPSWQTRRPLMAR